MSNGALALQGGSLGGPAAQDSVGKLDLGDLTCDTAMPVLDHPIWIFASPLGHRELAVHEALALSDACFVEIQLHIFTAGRLVDHADGEYQFDHSGYPLHYGLLVLLTLVLPRWPFLFGCRLWFGDLINEL